MKTLGDWIAKHPDDLAAVEQLADLEIVANRNDDAVKHLQAVLAKKPHDATALNNLAWVYQQQGDKRAEQIAQQAYMLSPSGQTADTLGWILISNGDTTPRASADAPGRRAGWLGSTDPVSLRRCAEGYRRSATKRSRC